MLGFRYAPLGANATIHGLFAILRVCSYWLKDEANVVTRCQHCYVSLG